MNSALTALCRSLEYAQAAQSVASAQALARIDPGSGARVLHLAGAWAVHMGPGHPLTQGLALGLERALTEADLQTLEGFLGQPTVLEVSAGADPSLLEWVARRGYRIQAFQQVWRHDLGPLPATPASALEVRPIRPDQAELFAQVVAAGFMDRDQLGAEGQEVMLPATAAQGTTCFLVWAGERPVGAGTVGCYGPVATLSAASVLPSWRGQGAQTGLIRARLAWARAAGCRSACSSTRVATQSQANLQRLGFRVAYPKLELARE